MMTSNMRRNLTYGICITALATALAGGWLYVGRAEQSPIQDYDRARDFEQVVDLAERNRYWLTSTPGYSFKHVFSHNSPNRNPVNDGILKTKVIREGDQLVGFTSYYMKAPTVGQLLFLCVNEGFRNKKYGEALLRYGIAQLKKMGTKKLEILTRLENAPAIKLYSRIGFQETSRDDTFVYMDYHGQ